MTNLQIAKLYLALNTTADAAAIDAAVTDSVTTVASFATTATTDVTAFLNAAYQAAFNRDADAEGLAYWGDRLATDSTNPITIDGLMDALLVGAEVYTGEGYTKTTGELVILDTTLDTTSATFTDDKAAATVAALLVKDAGAIVIAAKAAAEAAAGSASVGSVAAAVSTVVDTATQAAAIVTIDAADLVVDTAADAAITPTYTIAAAAASVTEGSPLVFTVTASEAMSVTPTTLNYNITGVEVAGGTADANTDLGLLNGTVVIAAGETTATFTLTPAEDGLTEGYEGFNVSLFDAAFETIATSGNVVISDPANAGQSYTLTAGIDTGIDFIGGAGDDTFTANTDVVNTLETFNSIDSLDGGAGNDTLNINASASGDFVADSPAAKAINIETVNVASSDDIVLNTTTWTGLDTLNITTTATSTITAAATTDVNELNSVDAVTIEGGNNVTVVHTDASDPVGSGDILIGSGSEVTGSIDIDSSYSATATTAMLAGSAGSGDTVTIGTNGTANTGALSDVTVNAVGDVNVTGATTIDFSVDHAVTLAARTTIATDMTAATTASGSASGDVVTASGSASGMAAIADFYSVANSGDGSGDTIATSDAITLAQVKAGTITVAQKVEIDSAYCTAWNAALAGEEAIDAQAAAKVILDNIVSDYDAAYQTALDAETAANAAYLVASGDAADDAAVSGDIATIDLAATDNTALTAVTATGNYGATVAITDTSTNKNTLTTVTLDNAGAATVSGDAVATINASNMVDNILLKASSATVDLNLDTVNNKIDLAGAANLTTLNIDVSNTNTLVVDSGDNVTALNLTGDGILTLDIDTSGALAADAVVTATTATGNITTTMDAITTSYLGGSGVDTISLIVGGANEVAAKIDGGAGTSDKIIVSTDASLVETTATEGAVNIHNFEILAGSGGTTLDIADFTNSTFTGIEANTGTVTFLNVTAAQALNVTAQDAATGLDITVVDSTVPGNMDTVSITTIDDVDLSAGDLTLAGVETINLTMSNSLAATVDKLTLDTLTTVAAMTDLNIDGAGLLSITTGALAVASNATIDASAVTASATTDTVTIDASASTANGLTIKGSSTIDNVLTASSVLEAGKTSVINGGAGDDNLTADHVSGSNAIINAGEGNNTISAEATSAVGGNTVTITTGDGHSTIDTDGGLASGDSADTITVGNGYNTITTGLGEDTITAGTGGNIINAGMGADTITMGDSECGVQSKIVFKSDAIVGSGDSIAATTASLSATITAGDTITFGNGVDVITGFNAASDVLDTEASGAAAVTMIGLVGDNLDGAAGTATSGGTASGDANYFVSGNFDADTGVFTITADGIGLDTLLLTAQDGASDTILDSTSGGAVGGSDSMVVLVGVDSDDLSAANFTVA